MMQTPDDKDKVVHTLEATRNFMTLVDSLAVGQRSVDQFYSFLKDGFSSIGKVLPHSHAKYSELQEWCGAGCVDAVHTVTHEFGAQGDQVRVERGDVYTR
jgi:hypothetical protein